MTGLNRSTHWRNRYSATNCDSYSGGWRVTTTRAAEAIVVGAWRTFAPAGRPNGRGGEPDHLIVVLGSSACDCVAVIKDCGADIVVNPFWESGLAGSIRLGVERAEEEGADSVLLLLADQPWLNSEVIRRFLDRVNGQTDLIISARYDGILGAPMMFGSDWFPQLKNLEGDQGARNLVPQEGGRVEVIDWSEGAIDVDTPEDLAVCLSSGSGWSSA